METSQNPTSAPETIIVPPSVDQVSCDGGSGPLGHPNVYYTFDGKSKVTCGYCGRAFVKMRIPDAL